MEDRRTAAHGASQAVGKPLAQLVGFAQQTEFSWSVIALRTCTHRSQIGGMWGEGSEA